jgi:hypothetical protein
MVPLGQMQPLANVRFAPIAVIQVLAWSRGRRPEALTEAILAPLIPLVLAFALDAGSRRCSSGIAV